MKMPAWPGSMSGACVVIVLGLVTSAATGDVESGRTTSGAELFSVSKSENRNQVHYAVRLDAACRPVGPLPVYAFWRMLERGPNATEPLLGREQPVYGILRQEVLALGEDSGAVRVTLHAFPDRPVVIAARATGPRAGSCAAVATTRIGGSSARLFNVHAHLRWPFGVDSLLLTGWAESDGHVVRETLRP